MHNFPISGGSYSLKSRLLANAKLKLLKIELLGKQSVATAN